MTNETEIAVLKNHMDNIEKKVDQGFESLHGRLDKLDQKFAGKWVETPLKLIGSLVAVALVGSLLALVIKG
jgi:tetrahydromethanopterin S-methyltransferase subunit G